MSETEYQFTLPCGYRDAAGNLHRQGTMRRATALDEVEPIRDPRVRSNEAYLGILLLSRVLTRLGPLSSVDPEVIERLFATDYVYLQELYAAVNQIDAQLIETMCPVCGSRFVLDPLEQHG